MLLKNGYVYRNETQSFEMLDVLVENGAVTQLGKISSDGHQTVDLSGKWIVPGLIDVHTHGRAGYDFASAPADALHVMAADFARHGVTSVMPAIASAPFEEMLAAAMEKEGYTCELLENCGRICSRIASGCSIIARSSSAMRPSSVP